MKKQNLKNAIMELLETNPETRNSDQYLTLCIWNRYFPDLLFKNDKGEPSTTLKNIMKLPREDSVKRIRCLINNEGLYLPTSPEVAKKRKINEEVWKDFIGRSTEYLRK